MEASKDKHYYMNRVDSNRYILIVVLEAEITFWLDNIIDFQNENKPK